MPQGYYPRPSVAERLLKYRKVTPSGCWEWTGWRDKDGYGGIGVRGISQRVHRVAWELAGNGAIPEGIMVCHKCDNPPCFNPDHLFLGTAFSNVHDAMVKGRKLGGLVGEANSNARLTEAIVRALRAEYAFGVPQYLLAIRYALPKVTVHNIVKHKTWLHV